MKNVEIFIEIEEGSGEPVFAPTKARHLIKNYYEITSLSDDILNSAIFNIGDYVYCLSANFSSGTKLIAYKKVSKEMVKYFMSCYNSRL